MAVILTGESYAASGVTTPPPVYSVPALLDAAPPPKLEAHERARIRAAIASAAARRRWRTTSSTRS